MIDAATLEAAGFRMETRGRTPHWVRLHGTCPLWWQGKWEAVGGSVGDRAVAIRIHLSIREANMTVLADSGGGDEARSRVTFEAGDELQEVVRRLIHTMTDAACEATRQVGFSG